jgi:hypothetical protein
MSQPSAGARKRRVLIIIENLPVPFDKRVWHEATTLVGAGYEVSVICPMGREGLQRHEVLEGVHTNLPGYARTRNGCAFCAETKT